MIYTVLYKSSSVASQYHLVIVIVKFVVNYIDACIVTVTVSSWLHAIHFETVCMTFLTRVVRLVWVHFAICHSVSPFTIQCDLPSKWTSSGSGAGHWPSSNCVPDVFSSDSASWQRKQFWVVDCSTYKLYILLMFSVESRNFWSVLSRIMWFHYQKWADVFAHTI